MIGGLVDALEKLEILAEAARFDAACTSSGSDRGPRAGSLGATKAAGCCHTFTPDGRCITLLKVLMSNACSYDCAYCVNRSSASCRRATFAPRELAELTVDFYKRNYIEGLFLSSGVLGTPDATSERMVSCLRTLREELRFNGYVHSKVIPGTSPELVDELGRLSDRLSVNLELPSERSLGTLCPNKTKSQVMTPMEQIFKTRAQEEERLLAHGGRRLGGPARRALGAGPATTGIQTSATASPAGPSDALARTEAALSRGAGTSPLLTNGACLTTMPHSRVANRRRRFAPAGQSTQIIVGASPEDDNHILKLSSALYRRFGLKRVFFSAYVPMMEDAHLPDLQTPVPLRREHRLYQADWLMRYYGFAADELVTPETPWLDLDVDPKTAWALAHIEQFPVEVMDASLERLLRVPGLGPVGARRIVAARSRGRLDFDDLKAMHVTLGRARHFITCCGKRDEKSPLDAELIRRKVVEDAQRATYNRRRRELEGKQLRLF